MIFEYIQISNHDNNKFILFLRKGVYPCEYMDYWKNFDPIQDGPFQGLLMDGKRN